jgi:hypothetical protein
MVNFSFALCNIRIVAEVHRLKISQAFVFYQHEKCQRAASFQAGTSPFQAVRVVSRPRDPCRFAKFAGQ